MMLGINESSVLSTRALEIGHDRVLAQAYTRQQLIKLGVFGAPLSTALVRRGEETVISPAINRRQHAEGEAAVAPSGP